MAMGLGLVYPCIVTLEYEPSILYIGMDGMVVSEYWMRPSSESASLRSSLELL